MAVARRARKTRRPLLWLAGPLVAAAVAALDLTDRPAFAAEPGDQPATIEVSLRDGLMSVTLREAPLDAVLRAIGEEAGFRVVVKGGLDNPVTWSFTNVPLDKALRRLLQNTNSVLIHGPARDGGAGRLVAVHAWPSHGPEAISAARFARTIRSDRTGAAMRPPLGGPDADRQDRLLAVRHLAKRPGARAAKDLALALSEDEDAVVRRVAAIGLGKVGGEPALAGLTAALADDDKWVRRRAIQGLGKIGGEAAARALGDTLVNDPEPEVRQAAARTLGRMRSEEAFEALKAAGSDLNFSVRQAVAQALDQLEDL
jgi:hypothetical protein